MIISLNEVKILVTKFSCKKNLRLVGVTQFEFILNEVLLSTRWIGRSGAGELVFCNYTP